MLRNPGFHPFDYSIELRMKNYVRRITLLSECRWRIYTLFRTLYDFTEEIPEKDVVPYSMICAHNSFMINRIQETFIPMVLDPSQIERFRHSLGRGIDSMSIPMNKMLESTEKDTENDSTHIPISSLD